MAIIEVFNLGKKYRIFYEKSSLIKSFFAWTKGRRIYEDFWALKDINFNIEKGETVGVIGRNGSGKTTLLKLLAGITKPELGAMKIQGFASSLLELGTGFQEELTGRENIFLNGSIFGLRKNEIHRKFDNIVNFAEIGRFIDSPMRTYSTGMWMRLGFALAINANFEVLLIDEVLAVGDISFQKKCFEKFNELKQKGITILFVSHNLETVKSVCNRAIWLDSGKLKAFDSVNNVTEMYSKDIEAGIEKSCGMDAEALKDAPAIKKRWGSKDAEIIEVFFTDIKGDRKEAFSSDGTFTINIRYFSKDIIKNPTFGFALYTKDGVHIAGPNTKAYFYSIDYIKGKGIVKFHFNKLQLLEGEYLVSASIYDSNIYHPYDHYEKAYNFFVDSNRAEEKYGILKPIGRWQHEKT